MNFRGYKHTSPIKFSVKKNKWPNKYINEPFDQYGILSKKYKNKNLGRIPLPISAQNLWSQHKYSVMARDFNKYKEMSNKYY